MVAPLNFWLLFAAAMLISSIGFKNYVWFISLGYGFSIAGEGLLMLLLNGKASPWVRQSAVCCSSCMAAVWADIWPIASLRSPPTERT